MDENRGIEKNDLEALTEAQQKALHSFKIKTRIGNETYLRNHPEVDSLIECFISDVCTARPDNPREYAAEYFTDPQLSLKVKALTQKKKAAAEL